jgi:hypothetical protein
MYIYIVFEVILVVFVVDGEGISCVLDAGQSVGA